MNWTMRIGPSGPWRCTAAECVARRVAGTPSWRFAVSGDSRNCGDVVMPAIAAGVKQIRRRVLLAPRRFAPISAMRTKTFASSPSISPRPLTKTEYPGIAWDDFTQNQMAAFGDTPFYLGIGNHDTVAPEDHAAFVARFSEQLDLPNLRAQRLKDDPSDLAAEDVLPLDRARRGLSSIWTTRTETSSSADQVAWLEKTLNRDLPILRFARLWWACTRRFPESLSSNHAMDDSKAAREAGCGCMKIS